MRAEAEVVQAADNYIIENSKDLNQVYAAELRSFIDSKTTQKQKEENKSFDSVKFSKTIGIASFELRDAVLTEVYPYSSTRATAVPLFESVSQKAATLCFAGGYEH